MADGPGQRYAWWSECRRTGKRRARSRQGRTTLLAWAETIPAARAGNNAANENARHGSSVERNGERHDDQGGGKGEVADLDDATRVSLRHELGDTDGEGEGRNANDDGEHTNDGRRPASNELQVGGHQNGLNTHEEERDGGGGETGEDLRGLKEGLGQQGKAVLLLDLLLDVDHNDEDDHAQDSHGGRGRYRRW